MFVLRFVCIVSCACVAIVVGAADEWSWQQPHATVTETGDLQLAQQPFVFRSGDSRRYIDYETGSDDAAGTREAPWKHHPWDAQATGAAAACSGVHTYIFKRGVTYRGTLTPRDAGTPEEPIRLTSEPGWGEGPAILSGAELATGWQAGLPHDDIPGGEADALELLGWYTDLDVAPRTVWMIEDDGTVTRIPLARTPNWTASNPDDVKSEWYQWDFKGRRHFGHKAKTEGGRDVHLAIDTVHITKPADYYEGAVIWSEWGWVMGTPYPTRVEYVDTTASALGFRGKWGGVGGQVIKGNRYYLEDKPHYLDAPGEYWFDKRGAGGRLYIRLPGDRDPSTVRVEVGARLQVIDATELRHVEISGLSFRHTNVMWDLTAGPWMGADVDPAAIRLLGSGEGITVRHCEFAYVHTGVRMKAAADSDAIRGVTVSDCTFRDTDHGAITLADGFTWGRVDGEIGRLYDVRVMRNDLQRIGLRPNRYGHGHAIEVDSAETLEVAGNMLDHLYGSGIFIWGAKRSGLAADRPLSRILIHHNKVTNSMLNTNDWGGIETWQGGPMYVYNNISGNPGGYWNYNFITPARDGGHANARFGHAYYLDGAYKNYLFNNIAWGKSSDPTSPLGNTAAFQEIHSFQNTFFNNTAYNFLIGSRRQAPHAGRNKYLANVWDTISYRVFRHADPAKSAAEGNAEHVGKQKDHFAYETNAYSANVFHDIARLGVLEANGRWLDTFAAYQAALLEHGALATDLGQETDSAPLRDPGAHDFRPRAGSTAIDTGVRVFVPWSLSAMVGEWNFYTAGASPETIIDEHWYMTTYYRERTGYGELPTFPLQAVNVTADSYVAGPLETWTRGALRLNGRDQYAVLRDATIREIAASLEPPKQKPIPAATFDWITIDAPEILTPGETATITVDLKGVPKGQRIQIDLHWSKADGAWGGMNTSGGSQVVKDGTRYTFTLTPVAKSGLGQFEILAFTSPDGKWNNRTNLARQKVLAAPATTFTADSLKSPEITTSNLLIESYLRVTAASRDAIIAEKMTTAGYSLAIDAEGRVRFLIRSGEAQLAVVGPALNDDAWHHVIAEADRATGTLTLYVDGKQVATHSDLAAMPAALSQANDGDLHVGGSPTGRCLAGDVDFLRIAQGTLADAKTTIGELYAWQFHGPQYRDFTGRAPVGRRDAGAIEFRD